MRVLTLGTFDIFHAGHINLIRKCIGLVESEGDVYVGLNSDDFVEKYKGERPVFTYEERKNAIKAVFPGVRVRSNEQVDGTIKNLVYAARCSLIVIGSDWGRKDYLSQIGLDFDWLDRNGIGLCYFPYTKGISTTEIKRRINEG